MASTVVHGWIDMSNVAAELERSGTDDSREWWLVSKSVELFVRNEGPIHFGHIQIRHSSFSIKPPCIYVFVNTTHTKKCIINHTAAATVELGPW